MQAPPPWSYGAFVAVVAPFAVRLFADELVKRRRAATEKQLHDAGIFRRKELAESRPDGGDDRDEASSDPPLPLA